MKQEVSRVNLRRLTSLRFFAALVVVLNHVTRDVAPIPMLSDLATMGTTAVGYFFVLSGFVLLWSQKLTQSKAVFYRRRLARVYPLHLVTLLLSIPVLCVSGLGFTGRSIMANLVLVQAWIPDSNVYFGMNAPSWALSCEVFFYFVFPYLLPRVHRLSKEKAARLTVALVLLNVAMAFGVTALIGGGEKARFLLYIFPPFRLLGFIAGMSLAQWTMKGARLRVPVWLAIVTALAAYLCVFRLRGYGIAIDHGVEDALLMPFLLILIASCASADLAGTSGGLGSQVWQTLGDWSFSLYLTHWLLVVLVGHFIPELKTATLAIRAAADLIFVLVSIAVAGVAHRSIEQPLGRSLLALMTRGSREPR